MGVVFLMGRDGWNHLSVGRPDLWFRWGVLEFIATGVMFVLALRWGPVGIATTWSLSLWMLTIPALWYAGRPIQLGIAPVIAVVWKYVLASLLAGGTTGLIVGELPAFIVASDPFEAAAARIAVISVSFGLLYVSAVTILHRSLAPLFLVARLVREMVPWGRPSKPSPAIATN